MERLCTPWRFAYVSGAEKEEGCVFCNRAVCDEREHYVLHRGRHWYLILNLYPYNSGHMLLVLNRHEARLSDCTPEELAEMARLLPVMEAALQETFRPDGINCGYNGGVSAGAGDTNFMSTIGETRVMPQTLDQAWEKLQPVVARLTGDA